MRSRLRRARQRVIAAWSPDSSTSGTSRPRHDAGRVYDGAFEQAAGPGAKRVLDGRSLVTQHAGQQPRDRLGDHQDGHFAAGQDVVTERDLLDRHARGRVVEDAGVDSLVPAAGEQQPWFEGEPGRGVLGEGTSGRRRHDQPRLRGRGRCDRVERAAPRLRQHDHARTAPVRGVVDAAVHIIGPPPQIMHGDCHLAPLDGAAQQGLSQGHQVVRKDRHDVQPQLGIGAHTLNSPSGASISTNPAAMSTVGTIAATNGTSRSPPSISRTR